MVKASLPGDFEVAKDRVDPTHTYKDEGCRKARELGYHGPYLECTIDPCLEDIYGAVSKVKKQVRDSEILEAIKDDKSTKDVARQFGVCQRTVQRAGRV